MSAKQQVKSDESTRRTRRTIKPPERYGEEIQQHKIHTTRASQAGKLSVLTRRINEVKELMKDKDNHAELNVIRNLITERLFPDVKEINEALINLYALKTEKQEAEEWFMKVYDTKELCLREIDSCYLIEETETIPSLYYEQSKVNNTHMKKDMLHCL